MTDHFDSSHAATIDRDNRLMAAAGYAMSQVLNDLYAQISAGNIGITAAAADVDALALGGGEFTPDYATSPANASLNFSWLASRFHNGKSLVAVAAGTLALAAASINYVEVNRAGVVSSNTAGFTAGRLPLWIVTTGAGNWSLGNVASQKPHLCLIGQNGVDGSMLSTPGQTKELHAQLGAVPNGGPATFLIMAPSIAAILVAAEFTESAVVAADDANYWTWAITNLGQVNAGVNPMLNTGAVNTTKATGGAALAANRPRALALHGVPGIDANLNTQPNDVLQLVLTPTGAPTALAQAAVRLDFTFAT